MEKFNLLTLMLIVALTFVVPAPAYAYIGPGAGLGAIAVTVALLLGVLLLIVGLVWYPLKRLLKRGKNSAEDSSGTDQTK